MKDLVENRESSFFLVVKREGLDELILGDVG